MKRSYLKLVEGFEVSGRKYCLYKNGECAFIDIQIDALKETHCWGT